VKGKQAPNLDLYTKKGKSWRDPNGGGGRKRNLGLQGVREANGGTGRHSGSIWNAPSEPATGGRVDHPLRKGGGESEKSLGSVGGEVQTRKRNYLV